MKFLLVYYAGSDYHVSIMSLVDGDRFPSPSTKTRKFGKMLFATFSRKRLFFVSWRRNSVAVDERHEEDMIDRIGIKYTYEQFPNVSLSKNHFFARPCEKVNFFARACEKVKYLITTIFIKIVRKSESIIKQGRTSS